MSIKANQTDQDRRKRLRRSVDGRNLGGIAAGLATFFALDVTHVRIALVVLALIGGAGLPLYLAAWVLIPEEGSDIAIADGLLHPGRSLVVRTQSHASPSSSFLVVPSYCCWKGSS